MFFKFLSNLEDPANPLLGPTLWGLQKCGMWQPENGIRRVIYNAIHLIALLYVVTQYVELWLIRSDMDMALRNLSVTTLSTTCVVKGGTFIAWQKNWRRVVYYVSLTEKHQLNKQDVDTSKAIQKYTKYSRTVTYFYWGLVTATAFIVIGAPFVGYLSAIQSSNLMNETIPYPEIMSSWTPFDKTQGIGYWALVFTHISMCTYGGVVIANYDANAVVLMSFFSGQLELLKSNCSKLFGDGQDDISYQVAVMRIRDCHEHHKLLVEYSKVLNSLLSPVLFLYVIICSLMICASAVQLTTEGTTTMQQVWIAEYLVALIAQLFIYCWHSDEVLLTSLEVDEGVYSSAWWSQDGRIRRSVALLGGQLNRSIVFTAGPFTKLTVPTFVVLEQMVSLVPEHMTEIFNHHQDTHADHQIFDGLHEYPGLSDTFSLGNLISEYYSLQIDLLNRNIEDVIKSRSLIVRKNNVNVLLANMLRVIGGNMIIKASYSYYTLLSNKEE